MSTNYATHSIRNKEVAWSIQYFSQVSHAVFHFTNEHLETCFGCWCVQEEGAPGEKFVVPVDKDTTGDVVLKITPEDGKTPKVTKVQKKVCKKASKDKLLILWAAVSMQWIYKRRTKFILNCKNYTKENKKPNHSKALKSSRHFLYLGLEIPHRDKSLRVRVIFDDILQYLFRHQPF